MRSAVPSLATGLKVVRFGRCPRGTARNPFRHVMGQEPQPKHENRASPVPTWLRWDRGASPPRFYFYSFRLGMVETHAVRTPEHDRFDAPIVPVDPMSRWISRRTAASAFR